VQLVTRAQVDTAIAHPFRGVGLVSVLFCTKCAVINAFAQL